jgi:hypothetical protein
VIDDCSFLKYWLNYYQCLKEFEDINGKRKKDKKTNNSTNILKTNNHQSPQIIEKDHGMCQWLYSLNTMFVLHQDCPLT